MKHTKRCGTKRGEHMKHVYVLDQVAIGGYLTQRRVTMLWDTCATCGTWLPLGPSDEAPVAVEVRAAEIAALRIEGEHIEMTMLESDGWLQWYPARGRFVDAYQAGYLARIIVNHDEEQAAGQALPDGGTTEGA